MASYHPYDIGIALLLVFLATSLDFIGFWLRIWTEEEYGMNVYKRFWIGYLASVCIIVSRILAGIVVSYIAGYIGTFKELLRQDEL